MFKKCDKTGYKEVLPGIRMKAVVYGDKTLMTEFLLKAGSTLPAHDHIHEQTGATWSREKCSLALAKKPSKLPRVIPGISRAASLTVRRF